MDIILSFLTAQICFVTIVFMALRKQKNGLVKTFIALHTLYFCWASCTLILLVFNVGSKAYLFVILKYISAFSLGPVWFIFYLYFSRSTWVKQRLQLKKTLAIFFPMMVLLTIYLTKGPDYSLYFFDEEGKIIYSNGLWLLIIIQSVYHFAGLIIVMRNAFTKQAKQLSILITTGYTLSQCITVLYYCSRVYFSFNYMDIVPGATLIILVTFFIAIYRYQFMNILPMALSEIVNRLQEGIMVVDGKGKIASVNNILEVILGKNKEQLLESNASDISDFILRNWKYNDESREAVLAIGKGTWEEVKGIIEYNDEIQYEIHCQPLKHTKLLIGWVVSFYNIHEHKNLTDELSKKNMKLSEAYTKLVEHANVVEELSASRERNRMAGEIHDSVGHCLSILVAMLEVIKMTYPKTTACMPVSEATPADSTNIVKEKINSAYNIAKNGLSELRHMVSSFSTVKRQRNNLLESIQSMIEGFEATGIKVDLTIQGDPPSEINDMLWSALYNTCREALTNALKHGEAQNVIIILRFDEELIELYIIDDGNGCNTIVKNMGLQGMENRINILNGRISFGSGGEKGFSIHVEIPR